ncbi:GM2 ganglioside activator [Chamberlinius hualienensis]
MIANRQHVNVGSFSWNRCSSENPIQIVHLSVSPDPIIIPGPLQITTKFFIPESLGPPNKYNAAFKVEKRMGTSWYTIPCLAGFGSCQYNDVCNALNELTTTTLQSCPQALSRNEIPCQCPFHQGEFVLNNGIFPLNFNVPAAIIDGEYHLNVNLRQHNNPTNLLCFDVWFTLKARNNNAGALK